MFITGKEKIATQHYFANNVYVLPDNRVLTVENFALDE